MDQALCWVPWKVSSQNPQSNLCHQPALMKVSFHFAHLSLSTFKTRHLDLLPIGPWFPCTRGFLTLGLGVCVSCAGVSGHPMPQVRETRGSLWRCSSSKLRGTVQPSHTGKHWKTRQMLRSSQGAQSST